MQQLNKTTGFEEDGLLQYLRAEHNLNATHGRVGHIGVGSGFGRVEQRGNLRVGEPDHANVSTS